MKEFHDWEKEEGTFDPNSAERMLTELDECYDNLMDELVKILQKRVLPGICDCCPDDRSRMGGPQLGLPEEDGAKEGRKER